MTELERTPIVDKNGKPTHVHRKPAAAPVGRLVGVPVPSTAVVLDLEGYYTHNDDFSGDDNNIPVITTGGNIAPNDAANWHDANEAELAVHHAYWGTKQDAEDNGTSPKDAKDLANAAAKRVSETLVEDAINEVKKFVGKKFRLGGGEVVRLDSVSNALSSNSLGEPHLRFSVTGEDGKSFDFSSDRGMGGMVQLRSETYSKSGDSFMANDTSYLDMHMGYPFEAGDVYDIARIADGDYGYPSMRYPILTGFGISTDINTGETGSKFEFTGIDGDKLEYVIPAERKAEIDDISLQPLRHKWDSYDPDILR